MSNTRDLLRSATLGRQTQFARKIVDYFPPIYSEVKDEDEVIGLELIGYEDDPIKVEVRQPTIRQRNDLVNKCRDKDTGKVNELEFIIQAAIHFVYDPESGENLYEATDYDALLETRAGDFVDQFGGAAVELLNIGEPVKNSKSSKKTKANKRPTQLPKT